MHHIIYPKQDTFITDTVGYKDHNFGLDEILRVGTKITDVKVTSPYTIYPFSPNYTASNLCVFGFSGSITTGSLWGTASAVTGSVFNTDDPVTFTVDFFSGSVEGDIIGWETGSYISSSNFTGSLADFSGSIRIQGIDVPDWNEILWDFNNWIWIWNAVVAGSGSISGVLSGSLSASFLGTFDGGLIGFDGKIMAGIVNGAQILNQQRQYMTQSMFYNRALVQFDLSAISSAMASGDIVNPKFTFKMNVAREENLPITYQIYINPISESWVMGNGYLSDGGSHQGASWLYRDYSGGTAWATSGSTYLNSPAVSQSFEYQVGDINVDLSPIVYAWISGTIPNNGILIRSSDESGASKTGMALYFFSEDTNTIYVPRLDVGWHDSTETWTTGSVSTASTYVITSSAAGLYGTVVDSASVSGSFYGGFNGICLLQTGSASMAVWSLMVTTFDNWWTVWDSITSQYAAVWGFMDVMGSSGLINGWHIFGNFSGSASQSYWQSFKKCKRCQPTFNEWWPQQNPDYVIYGVTPSNGPGFASGPCSCGSGESAFDGVPAPWWWSNNGQCCADPSGSVKPYTGGFQWVNKVAGGQISSGGPCDSASYTGSMVTMSFIMGTLLNGDFSSSTFTASLINGYQLNYGILHGNWNSSMLYGTSITSSYPLVPMFPSAVYVYFSGPFIGGMALGSIVTASNSGTFDGMFVNGPYAGDTIHAPYTGSIITASTETTVAILQSSSLSPVNVNRPFTTVIQNIPNVVRAGNVIRVNVFARPEHPLKNFNRQTQFEQFLIPQYLPSSSYYAIKDNETEEIIVDFDNYTQISCDANGNYFMVDTTGLPQERYFRLLIKTELSGSIYTFDRGDIFKIVR